MNSILNTLVTEPYEYTAFRAHTSASDHHQPGHLCKPLILLPVQEVPSPCSSAEAGLWVHPVGGHQATGLPRGFLF